MSKVHIVTDSAAQLDPKLVEKLDITVLPLEIKFGSQSFLEGVDLSTQEFYHRVSHSSVMPTSIAPSVEQFRQVYADLNRETDKIVSLHVSNKLNQTCQNALLAANDFLGRCEIVVINSWTISIGLAILVEAGARVAMEGGSLEDVVRTIRGMIPHVYAVFFTDLLDYLERARRITKSQSILGTMLNIKPFLTIEEGEILPIEKMRTRDKAVDKLLEFVAEFSRIEKLAILKSALQLSEESRNLAERLRSSCPDLDFFSVTYGPTLATHIGPHSLGLIVYEGTD